MKLGKRAKIGLAFVLVVLIVGVILVVKPWSSPAATTEDTNPTDQSQAVTKGEEQNTKVQSPMKIPGIKHSLTPAPPPKVVAPVVVAAKPAISDPHQENALTTAADTKSFQGGKGDPAPSPPPSYMPAPPKDNENIAERYDRHRQAPLTSSEAQTAFQGTRGPDQSGVAEAAVQQNVQGPPAALPALSADPPPSASMMPSPPGSRYGAGTSPDWSIASQNPLGTSPAASGSDSRNIAQHQQTAPRYGGAPRYELVSNTADLRNRNSLRSISPTSLTTSSGLRKDGTYVVQPLDSYWTISEKLYGTGAYFRALAELNRGKTPQEEALRIGDVISAPSVKELEQKYPELCPKPRHREVLARQALPVSTQHRLAGGRRYTVTEGDTLFDIARYELGKAARWVEIYELNCRVIGQDIDYLVPGTELVLPEKQSARPDPLTRRATPGYRQ